MIAVLAFPPFVRLVRGWRAWVTLAVWFSLALALGAFTRARGLAHPADHVLVDLVGALILPLLVYLLVGAMLGTGSVSASTSPLVALGARPAWAAAALVAVGAVCCCVCGAALGGAVAALAHGPGDPPRLGDAVASAYAGGLGGAAYACWFSCGAAFGRRGGGRPVALVLDWLIGTQSGAGALIAPRAHLRNLLGGAPPIGLPEWASALALVGLSAACTMLTVHRTRARR